MRLPLRIAALTAISLMPSVPALARAQRPQRSPVSLRDAIAEADRGGYANRGAAAIADAQRAQALAPLAGIVPNVRVETGYNRTTDPIGVFGATLRQRAVTQANFDPARLNYPSAIGNYQAAIILEQPLVNVDAWAGRQAALRGAAAVRSTDAWTRLSTRADVVRTYYGVVLADERATALRTAARAAHAHVAQAEAMVKQGLVTKSDALLASVRAGDIEAQLAEAEGDASTARRRFALVLGRDVEDAADVVLTAMQMPSTERIRAEVASDTIAPAPGARGAARADVRAATDGLEAARGDARRARASLLPRINGFARYDWNSAATLYAGDRNWTAGIMASWNVLSGARELADVQATTSRVHAAEAQAEGTRANALFEIEQTRTALSVALTRLDIAEHAVVQSVEAHRIVSARYVAGLAGVSELLDAQAAETQSTLAVAQARWSAIVSAADRRRALGLDPATLASLDDTSVASARSPRADR